MNSKIWLFCVTLKWNDTLYSILLAIPYGVLLHYNKVHEANFTDSLIVSSLFSCNLIVKCHFHFLDSLVIDSDSPWMTQILPG